MVKKIVLLGLMVVALASCSLFGGYNFIDQTLQGQMVGAAWTYDAAASHVYVSGSDLQFSIYDTGSTGEVMFTVPAEVGVTELGLFAGKTATIYTGGTNYICVDGGIEILTVDLTAHTVTGRCDISSDSSTWVNGNFSLTW